MGADCKGQSQSDSDKKKKGANFEKDLQLILYKYSSFIVCSRISFLWCLRKFSIVFGIFIY